MNYGYELHTEFAMWRKVLEETRSYYLSTHIDRGEFERRLSTMGFRPHEISAEHAYIESQRITEGLEEALAQKPIDFSNTPLDTETENI